jgi:hypothetical protein
MKQFSPVKRLQGRMDRGKPVMVWIVITIFSLGLMEAAACVYYFQRGSAESAFALGQILHGVKTTISRRGAAKAQGEPVHLNDDTFGWTLRNNLKLAVNCPDSTPTYTTDSNKQRFIAKPTNPAGRILFLGDEITFGHCVGDNELYPSILATEYWKNWEVQNKAVSGWGTTQAFIALSAAMKTDRPPSMVIYGMTPHHIKRNYLRRTWLLKHTEKGRKLPYFEVINDDLVFQGTAGPSSGLEDGPELRRKEHEITVRYLSAMREMCAKKNIPFIVVFLPPSGSYPLAFIDKLYDSNFLRLDLTETAYDASEPGEDNHLKATGHKMVARAIAASFVSNVLVKIEHSVK